MDDRGPEVGVFESRFARNGRGAPEEVCPPLKAQSGESGKGDAAPLVYGSDTVAATLKSRTGNGKTGVGGRTTDVEQTLVVEGFRSSGRGYFDESGEAATLAASPRAAHEDTLLVSPVGFDHQNLTDTGEVAHTLRAGAGAGNTMPMAYNVQPVSTREERGAQVAAETDTAEARTASDGKRTGSGTVILDNGDEVPSNSPFDPKPDGPRYAAMGDAVTVNVITWLGVGLRDHYERELSAGGATIPA